MGERRCSIDGCERPHYARNWCRRHYSSWYTHGDPLAATPRQAATHGTTSMYWNHDCRCAGCRDAHARWMRDYLARRGEILGPCDYVGCDARQYVDGLCKTHYERRRTGRDSARTGEQAA